MSTPLVKIPDAFAETEIDDEIVVMALDTGDFFSLTGTGRAIWRLLDGARSEADIRAAVAQEFAANPDAIADDVAGFLAQLRQAGFVRGGA